MPTAECVAMAAGIASKAEAGFIADALDKSAESVLKARLGVFLGGRIGWGVGCLAGNFGSLPPRAVKG